MNKLEKAMKKLKDKGFYTKLTKEEDKYSVLIENWADNGMDCLIADIDVKDIKELADHLEQYNEYYDPDEEVELYVNMRGQRGIPERVMDILDDCEQLGKFIEQAKNIVMSCM